MYIIIKKDKAEHLKEKMHHIKSAVMEVLDCIENAPHTSHHPEEYSVDHARRRGAHMDRDYEYDREYAGEYEDYVHDSARGRGRGRGRY